MIKLGPWNPHATSELITLNEDLSISSTYGPTFPTTVWGHSMINLNGSIYLFGGYQNNVTSKICGFLMVKHC